MKSNDRSKYITNTVFLCGLAILLLNDHVLKAEYGNWMTGKLSDVAGVLIFPLFIAYITGWRKTVTVGLTVLFFCWWKSPLSGSFIEAVSGLSPISFSRVVDYTDLYAFAILPLSWWALEHPDRFTWRAVTIPSGQMTAYLILPVCVMAFVATSVDEPFPSAGGVVDCCTQSPIDTMIGNGYVYVPTAITDDDDGINDVFQIVADDNIVRIDSMKIFSRPDSFLLFRADSITEFTPETGWAPRELGGAAQFSVLVEIHVVAEDGTTATLRNLLCSVPCPAGMDDEDFDGPGFPTNCTFGNQVDGTGRFDRNIDPGEDLQCF